MPIDVFEKRRNGELYSAEINFVEDDFLDFLRDTIPEVPDITNHLSDAVVEAMDRWEITFDVKGSSPGRKIHVNIKLPGEPG